MSVRRLPKEQEGSLIQRCVIVQKDENGYGLTVSGDNPVYVQSVRENGSAAKAGVQVGDRIIKVNGMPVTKANHIEVVKLIKSGSYVALTLLGKAPVERPSSGTPSPLVERSFTFSRNSSTSPTQKDAQEQQQQQNDRVVSLQRMLDQEYLYYNKTLESYKIAPSSKLQKDLAETQTRIKAIESQIRVISSNHNTLKQQLTSQSARSVFKPLNENKQASPKAVNHSRSKSAYAIRSHSASAIPYSSPFASDYPRSEYDFYPRATSLDHPDDNEPESKSDSPLPDSRPPSEEGEQQPAMAAATKTAGLQLITSINEGLESSPVVETTEQQMESENTVKKGDYDEQDFSVVVPPPVILPQLSVTQSDEFVENQDSVFQGGKIEHLNPLNPAMSVISMEDEEFEPDNEKIDDHGPFVDLNCLKNKPAHLAIFLHFLMSNSDPSALFFWLVTEIYAIEQGSVKEYKKWAYEIYSVFLSPNAPLKVTVSESTDLAIDESLNNKNCTEEGVRNIFKMARLFAFNEVSEQLADFRTKRALGLGSLFGDHQLEDELDKHKELKVVEDTLLPHIEALVIETESGNNGSPQYDRNSAMASSLATFMKHVRNNTKPGSSLTSPLDKCRSFVEKERSSLFRFRPSKKVLTIKGHQFVAMQYSSITQCHFCGETLCGIGHQGFQCSACEYNVHKGACCDAVDEVCPGSKRKYKQERNKARRGVIKEPKPRTSAKEASPDEVVSPLETKPDAQPVSSEPRSRDNSLSDDLPKSSSVVGKESLLSEDSTLSETETERSESRQSTTSVSEEPPVQHIAQTTSLRSKPLDNWRRRELYGGLVDRSISLRTPKDLAKIQEKKRSIPPLPGLQSRSGALSDNGVYAAYPFPGPKLTESPPVSEDEEEWDPDLDVDEEFPIWSQVVDKKIVKGLKTKEIKRQEVILELIHTEKTHVRKLRVLQKVFYKPIKRKHLLQPELLQQLFPNLEDLIAVHVSLLAALKARSAQNEVVQAIGDIMLERFDGAPGEVVKEAAAKFCNYQKIALEALKARQKKDPKFNAFMMQQELNPLCQRLKFADIIAQTHQRFTKYPLLLESIVKSTLQNHPDRKDVEKCVGCCKAILNKINQTIKETENSAWLAELSKKIEVKQVESSNQNMKKEIMELDITKHKLIRDGDLTWRVTRNKSVELHALLLDDVLVLLQKQDEKYILKCHSTTTAGASIETKKNTHSPVIKLANLLIRNVATDKKAFFLVSTSSLGPQIYEMVTGTATERRGWVKMITDAVESAKMKERGRRGGLSLGTTPTIPETNGNEENIAKGERKRKESDEDDDDGEDASQSDTSLSQSDTRDAKAKSPVDFDKLTNEAVVDDHTESGGAALTQRECSVESNEEAGRRKFEPPSKERMTYLYEQLKQKDEELRRVLEEKQKIIAELRGENPSSLIHPELSQDLELEPRELVLAAILQANRLTLAVNEACNIHRGILADANESGEGSLSTSHFPTFSHENRLNSEDESQRQDVMMESTTILNEQLTGLLSLVTERDTVRERLYSELQSAKAAIQRFTQRSTSVTISQGDGEEEQMPESVFSNEICLPPSPILQSIPSDEILDGAERTNLAKTSSKTNSFSEDSTVVSGLNADTTQDDSIFVTNPFKHPTPRVSDVGIRSSEEMEVPGSQLKASSFSEFSNIAPLDTDTQQDETES